VVYAARMKASIYRIEPASGGAVYAQSLDGASFEILEGSFPELSPTGQTVSGRVLAPIIPPAIYIVGYNYAGNPLEARKEIGEHPVIVMKASSTVVGQGDAILIPGGLLGSDQVDYEGELAVVIGKSARNVRREDAISHIFGYTIANDVTARDRQKGGAGGQWVRGKNFDSFCPLGPAIVPKEALKAIDDFKIQTWVNDTLRQEDSTASMIFSIPEIIEHLSASNTLLPGTVILTGTPAGTGVKMQPPQFLKVGDRVRIEISGLGVLENPVLSEVL